MRIALLLALLPSVALADMKRLPVWTMTNGKACYEFQDAKKVMELDYELDMLLQKEAIWKGMTNDYHVATSSLSLALEAEKSANKTLVEATTILNRQLVAETTRANKASAEQMPSVGWLVAGGVTLVAGGVVLGYLLTRT